MNFDRLTAFLDSRYTERNVPHAGCVVYYRHQPVYSHYMGLADVDKGEPFTDKHIVTLYSATKISLATAAMQLLETGAFGLDEPIARYLPEFAAMVVRETDADGKEHLRPAASPILIRHLLSMSAGLDYDRSPELDAARQAADGRPTTAEVVRAIAKKPLCFDPGTHFRYSYCLDVIGRLIEVVSGESLGDYFQKHLFDPIGMTDTTFHPSEAQRARMAYQYFDFDHTTRTYRDAHKHLVDMGMGDRFESGGGGLVSTVPDYALLAETLCNFGLAPSGARILRPESINLMRQNQLCPAAQRDFAAFGGPSKAGYSYGLGVRTMCDRDFAKAACQNGEFGWDGALGCYMVVDPDAEMALFYAQQAGGEAWWEWHPVMRDLVYACLAE